MINQAPFDVIGTTSAPTPVLIEFFSIQLSTAPGGRYFVGIEATICDGECDLSQMELGHHQAASLDDALSVIREAVIAH